MKRSFSPTSWVICRTNRIQQRNCLTLSEPSRISQLRTFGRISEPANLSHRFRIANLRSFETALVRFSSATIRRCSSFGCLAIVAAADTETSPASIFSTNSGTPVSTTALARSYCLPEVKPDLAAAMSRDFRRSKGTIDHLAHCSRSGRRRAIHQAQP